MALVKAESQVLETVPNRRFHTFAVINGGIILVHFDRDFTHHPKIPEYSLTRSAK
jgi:hypothetical protein